MRTGAFGTSVLREKRNAKARKGESSGEEAAKEKDTARWIPGRSRVQRV
jgi:hypothetical protein